MDDFGNLRKLKYKKPQAIFNENKNAFKLRAKRLTAEESCKMIDFG